MKIYFLQASATRDGLYMETGFANFEDGIICALYDFCRDTKHESVFEKIDDINRERREVKFFFRDGDGDRIEQTLTYSEFNISE